jgi:hypothetical protein
MFSILTRKVGHVRFHVVITKCRNQHGVSQKAGAEASVAAFRA